ncbi:MAG: GDSL family lipase [Caldibacillus debilis]|uniref:SGNH/GDSL hydrolase family protein n=1 Tax=Caldibacillus debilis TaxID=301148 RepID=UPI000E39669F|nr:SGNH/GDSL hydrolase family protein [Caldibacillus debilis]REJ18150.1 MAG: GDSL family lipase [Caldibacillus debilis]
MGGESVKGAAVKWVSLFSLLSTLLWITGFFIAFHDQAAKHSPPPSAEGIPAMSPKGDDGAFRIVALGDSLTRGTGDETGKGYVGYLADHIKKRTGKKILLRNLAVRGMVSEKLLGQLRLSEVQRQISDADLILMTIGGNDLFQKGKALQIKSQKDVGPVEKKFLRHLDAIFREIRKRNPNAYVFFIGLYNPFSDLAEGKTYSEIIRRWNFAAFETAEKYPRVVAVPVFDLFEIDVNGFLNVDKFHPNAEGYRRIAQRLASLVPLAERKESG